MNCCSGKCCAVFYYPRTPEELKELGNGSHKDAEFIADMLVPLSKDDARTRMEQFDISTPDGLGVEAWLKKADGHAFTCRHWDEDTQLCTVYDKRPRMCRDYPYDKECQHGCGYALPQARQQEYIKLRSKSNSAN